MSDPAVSGMESIPGLHVLTLPKHISEGITVWGPQTGDRQAGWGMTICNFFFLFGLESLNQNYIVHL